MAIVIGRYYQTTASGTAFSQKEYPEGAGFVDIDEGEFVKVLSFQISTNSCKVEKLNKETCYVPCEYLKPLDVQVGKKYRVNFHGNLGYENYFKDGEIVTVVNTKNNYWAETDKGIIPELDVLAPWLPFDMLEGPVEETEQAKQHLENDTDPNCLSFYKKDMLKDLTCIATNELAKEMDKEIIQMFYNQAKQYPDVTFVRGPISNWEILPHCCKVSSAVARQADEDGMIPINDLPIGVVQPNENGVEVVRTFTNVISFKFSENGEIFTTPKPNGKYWKKTKEEIKYDFRNYPVVLSYKSFTVHNEEKIATFQHRTGKIYIEEYGKRLASEHGVVLNLTTYFGYNVVGDIPKEEYQKVFKLT